MHLYVKHSAKGLDIFIEFPNSFVGFHVDAFSVSVFVFFEGPNFLHFNFQTIIYNLRINLKSKMSNHAFSKGSQNPYRTGVLVGNHTEDRFGRDISAKPVR